MLQVSPCFGTQSGWPHCGPGAWSRARGLCFSVPPHTQAAPQTCHLPGGVPAKPVFKSKEAKRTGEEPGWWRGGWLSGFMSVDPKLCIPLTPLWSNEPNRQRYLQIALNHFQTTNWEKTPGSDHKEHRSRS